MSSTYSPVWFTRHFGINKPQYELDFVDFDINSDVPLYIDLYAVSIDATDFGKECHNSIVSYFQALLNAVREGNDTLIRYLIRGRLVEPREIHLGVGLSARSGIE